MMGNLLSISKNCNLHTWRNWAAWSKSCQVSKVQTSEAGSSSSIRTEELVEVCCSSRRLAAASFSCSGKASFGSHSHPSGGPILPSFLGAIHQKLKIGHGSCFRELWKIAFLFRWSLSQHPLISLRTRSGSLFLWLSRPAQLILTSPSRLHLAGLVFALGTAFGFLPFIAIISWLPVGNENQFGVGWDGVIWGMFPCFPC